MSRGIRKKTEEKRKEDKRGVLWKRGKKKKEKGLAWAFGLVNFKEERERKKKKDERIEKEDIIKIRIFFFFWYLPRFFLVIGLLF